MKYEIKGLRYHTKELQLITNLTKPISGKLQSSDKNLSNIKARFVPKEYKYELKLPFGLLSSRSIRELFGKDLKDTSFEGKGFNLQIDDGFVNHQSMRETTVEVRSFFSKGFVEKRPYYHKVFIPLRRKDNPLFTIETALFTSNIGFKSQTATVALLEKEELAVCFLEEKLNGNWLVIESSQKQTLKRFQDKVHIIQLALGYFMAHYPGDKGYFFAYTQKPKNEISSFYVSTLRPSMYSNYIPVQQKPFSMTIPSEIAKKYQPSLQPLSINEFSAFICLLASSSEWMSALTLIVEANETSLVLMPGSYAIALETIVKLIPKKSKKTPLLSNKKEKKFFLESCYAALDKISAGKSEKELKAISVIRSKIPNLLQQTNQEKLNAPFESLGIHLNKYDKEALQTRNDFLHGCFPDVTGAGLHRSIDRVNMDLLYCSLRFYNLINKLILSMIGFKGYFCNYCKLYELQTGVKLEDEDFYIPLGYNLE